MFENFHSISHAIEHFLEPSGTHLTCNLLWLLKLSISSSSSSCCGCSRTFQTTEQIEQTTRCQFNTNHFIFTSSSFSSRLCVDVVVVTGTALHSPIILINIHCLSSLFLSSHADADPRRRPGAEESLQNFAGLLRSRCRRWGPKERRRPTARQRGHVQGDGGEAGRVL